MTRASRFAQLIGFLALMIAVLVSVAPASALETVATFVNTAGPADSTLQYGLAGDQALAGNWDGDGIDTSGLSDNGVVFLRNRNTTGFADVTLGYGIPGDVLTAGDWDSDRATTIGVSRSDRGECRP